jgi:hypothetical protein
MADHALGIASPEYGQLADSVPRLPNIGSPSDEGGGLRKEEEDLIHPASGGTAGAKRILEGQVVGTAVASDALAGTHLGRGKEGRDLSMELDGCALRRREEKGGISYPDLDRRYNRGARAGGKSRIGGLNRTKRHTWMRMSI